MNSLQAVAQISVEHILNALPEGILIAAFAWVLLRTLRKQNAGTRFAVWFLSLMTVAALPVLSAWRGAHALTAVSGWSPANRAEITISAPWALIAFLVWAAIASAAILRLSLGLWGLRKLRQSCTPISIVNRDLDPLLRNTLSAIRARQKSVSHPITIATSEAVRVPAAIGFFKRTIVLPAWTWRELPAQDLNVILLHEFAHLRRADEWTNLVQKIVRALFFFHPAVWWIEKQLSVEREMACDDAVLAETANPRGYAACLVSLLEKTLTHRQSQSEAQRPWSLAQAAVHRAHEAALRLTQILDSNRPVATRVWKPALVLIGAFAIALSMALPLAPKLVAVDRGTVSDSTPADSIASSRSSLMSSGRGPAVIPASLPIDEQYSPRISEKISSTKLTKAKVGHSRTVFEPRDARSRGGLRIQARSYQVIQASASAQRQAAPQRRTFLLLRATEYASSEGPVWSVQVWRVCL